MNTQLKGWISGSIGIFIFAGSLPATKLAIQNFSPEFVTTARAAIAGIIACLLLLMTRQKRPSQQQWYGLITVCMGVVIGFPLFTALALQQINAASSTVFIGILPLITAFFAVVLSNERPQFLFWLFSAIGSLCICSYILLNNATLFNIGSLYMLIAIILCGFGYAQGAKLSKSLGSWQVICWALVLTLPLSLLLTIVYFPTQLEHINPTSYYGLVYVSLFSMLIGFFFWYHGLSIGGIASIGQLQLLQPMIGLVFSAWLLHEQINPTMWLTTIAILISVLFAKKYA